jgi:hypothetical protein
MRTQTLSSSKCSTQATVQLQPIELNSKLKSKRGFKPRLDPAHHREFQISTEIRRRVVNLADACHRGMSPLSLKTPPHVTHAPNMFSNAFIEIFAMCHQPLFQAVVNSGCHKPH